MPQRFLQTLTPLVGAFLLGDSLSQLIQALGVWDAASPVWRAGALRLLFTQVTPLMLALLLIGVGTVRSVRGLRTAAGVGAVLALLVLALGALLAADASRAAAALSGDALLVHRRGMIQGLTSALAAGVGLGFAGLALLLTARKESGAPLRAAGS